MKSFSIFGSVSPAAQIVLICIAAAVIYGLIHDQITARICIEYFTIAHPRVLQTDSPTLVALYWGVAATWWVGFILGLLLAIACRAGSPPRLTAGQLVRPIVILLICMAIAAAASGVTGYLLTIRGIVTAGDWADEIPPAAHARFVADAFTHLASYAVGFLGGLVIVGWALRERYRAKLSAPVGCE